MVDWYNHVGFMPQIIYKGSNRDLKSFFSGNIKVAPVSDPPPSWDNIIKLKEDE